LTFSIQFQDIYTPQQKKGFIPPLTIFRDEIDKALEIVEERPKELGS